MVCRRLRQSVSQIPASCVADPRIRPYSSLLFYFSYLLSHNWVGIGAGSEPAGAGRARRCAPLTRPRSDSERRTRREPRAGNTVAARVRRQAVRDAVLRGVHAPRQASAGAPRRAGHRRRPGAPRAQRAREPVRQVRRARSAAAPFSRFLSGIARQSAQRQASGALRTRSVKWCLPTPPSGPFSRRHRHHRGASRTTSLLGGAAETARGAARPRRFARRR
jgi:hypothetical protein